MLLATQCPHCFTSFRVANDQLKLHAGLVRCGACQQTFNGIEYLLAPGAKPALPPKITPVTGVIPAVDAHAADVATSESFTPIQVAIPEIEQTSEIEAVFISDETFMPQSSSTYSAHDQTFIGTSASSALEFDLGDDIPIPLPDDAKVKVLKETEQHDDAASHAEMLSQSSLFDLKNNNSTFGEPQPEPNTPVQEQGITDVVDEAVSIEEHEPTEPVESDTPVKEWNAVINVRVANEEKVKENVDLEKPDFVIQAEKKQRRSRFVGVLMINFSTLLFFTLLAQSAYVLRNHISAWFPQTKPVLQEACKLLRCRIELPTQIEAISIESNELQALSNDKNIFSLSIQLQNKSATLQAWPMLELILNDAKDKPVVQRVFTPADYLTNKNDLIKGLAANGEQTIKLYFELSGPKASGYHVGVFYP